MNHTQRVIHAKLKAGHVWTGDLHKKLYRDLGIGSVHLNMAYRQLMAKLSSIKELAKSRVNDLKDKIKSKEGEIGKKNKAVAKNKRDTQKLQAEIAIWKERVLRFKAAVNDGHTDSEKHLKRSINEYYAYLDQLRELKVIRKNLEFALHQNKRRLGNLRDKLKIAEKAVSNPSICFGTKKLFKQQFYLKENDFKDHKEWSEAWRAARNSQFKFEGDSLQAGGNLFARLSVRDDGLFDLELRLPEKLKHLAQETIRNGHVNLVRFYGLSFNHGSDVVREALSNKQPVTVSFIKDETSWKVSVTVDQKLEWIEPDYSCGALGVDFNANHVAVSLIDRFGNPVKSWTLPLNTYGLSGDQAQDLIRKCAKQIIDIALEYGVPIVSEKLDFARKKRELKAEDGAKYARMLSALTYSGFDAALASACARFRVAHRRVNPAYTSLIGRVKFASSYGLSVHTAAAVSIARRAMGFSEGLPRQLNGTVIVPFNNSEHVTFALPARKEKGAVAKAKPAKHVWSEWRELNKEMIKAHAEQRLSGRVKRSRPFTRRHWRECGGASYLHHGLSGLIGRAVTIQLSRNGQGLAKRQEAIPEMKIQQRGQNTVSTSLLDSHNNPVGVGPSYI
jgi:IS605 OrfB family transposase